MEEWENEIICQFDNLIIRQWKNEKVRKWENESMGGCKIFFVILLQNGPLKINRMQIKFKRVFLTFFVMCGLLLSLRAEDGYRLWLRYDKIDNPALLSSYRKAITGIQLNEKSLIFASALNELKAGLGGLLDKEMPVVAQNSPVAGSLVAGTPQGNSLVASFTNPSEMKKLGDDGYVVKTFRRDRR